MGNVAELHIRASQWCEDNGLELEAFHHAAAGNDIERAERLIEGKGIPLTFRGASVPVMNWLGSLPKTVLDARPSLWVMYASTLLFSGKNTAVEQKLQAAEAALQSTEPDDKSQDLLGRVSPKLSAKKQSALRGRRAFPANLKFQSTKINFPQKSQATP
jgi:LuxR family maltose regulon positive regulatory protein